MATPWACDRKSWSLTGVGVRSHLVPGFLKFPTNSLFLASTLITGFPCRPKRRRSLWIWANCASRRGCLGPIFLRFTRSEKCSLRSKRATVRALTRMRNRSSCAAILAVVRRVHRKPLRGSPAVSGSNNLSIARITSGVFFPSACAHRPLSGSAPHPHHALPVGGALWPRCADPVAAIRHLLISPATQLERLQAGVQPALLFVV